MIIEGKDLTMMIEGKDLHRVPGYVGANFRLLAAELNRLETRVTAFERKLEDMCTLMQCHPSVAEPSEPVVSSGDSPGFDVADADCHEYVGESSKRQPITEPESASPPVGVMTTDPSLFHKVAGTVVCKPMPGEEEKDVRERLKAFRRARSEGEADLQEYDAVIDECLIKLRLLA